MRISSAALLLLLAGCGERAADTDPIAAAEQGAGDAGDRIPCARGKAALAPVCTVDRERRDEGLVLVVRHPDGGFRRLLVTTDGRGVVAADGAERARVTVSGPDRIDVALGEDRYRLPATVRASR